MRCSVSGVGTCMVAMGPVREHSVQAQHPSKWDSYINTRVSHSRSTKPIDPPRAWFRCHRWQRLPLNIPLGYPILRAGFRQGAASLSVSLPTHTTARRGVQCCDLLHYKRCGVPADVRAIADAAKDSWRASLPVLRGLGGCADGD